MDIENFKIQLRKLGLTDYESSILLYLITQEDYVNAKEISKSSKVPMGRIYSILIELEEVALIKKISGKVSLYKIEDKKTFIKSLTKKNISEIKKQENEIQNATDVLKVLFPKLKNDENKGNSFEINYFNEDEKYWKVYIKAVNSLKKGDKYRIINSLRLGDSFLNSELKNNTGLRRMINNDNKKRKLGIDYYLITNPRSIVENIIKELKDEKLIEESIITMLKIYKYYSKDNSYITTSNSFNSLIIVILKDDVFLEFYSDRTNKLTSAIHINNNQTCNDLGNWFDGFIKNDLLSPKECYKNFEKEVKDVAFELLSLKL